ncbi:MAG: HD domain-containing protein [Chloracidobacterium sp.]|nr:HD domain-containing protein [Chloracidobacterium sp.]MDW8218432.1 HD domain-containing protein [Acidobacteriota bacterium]
MPNPWAARLAECEAEAARLDALEGYAAPHAVRLAAVTDRLAAAFGLSERGRRDLRAAALLHDVGEGGGDFPFLTAARPLTFSERCALWRHPIVGERLARKRGLPEAVGLLVRWHHENWDGSGYPDGLRGEQIPLPARLLRIADVWCALTNDRPFRPAYTPVEAVERMRGMLGTVLDPVAAACWLDSVAAGDPTVGDNCERSLPAATPWMTVVDGRQAAFLGFELAALQTLSFQSIALPYGGDGSLGWRLKLLGKQVFSNDARQAEACLAVAAVENNGYVLTASQVDAWLQAARDAEANPDFPYNPALRQWFNPAAARWLAGFRQAVLRAADRVTQALGVSLGLHLGDYWLAFDPSVERLRQTFEDAAIEALARVNCVIDNGLANQATCLPAHVFVVQTTADVIYLRLPSPTPYDQALYYRDGWRELWVRDAPDALVQLTLAHTGRFGGRLASRREYLAALRSLLRRLAHFPQWVIGCAHEAQLPDDLLAEISRFRPVARVLTKTADACGTLPNQSIIFCLPEQDTRSAALRKAH